MTDKEKQELVDKMYYQIRKECEFNGYVYGVIAPDWMLPQLGIIKRKIGGTKFAKPDIYSGKNW